MFISVTCGGSLSQKQGNFTSPLYPSFYPPAKDCKWTITVCTTLPFPSPSSAWTFTPHTPPAPPPPSPCLACHERDAEAALLLSTSSIFICQTAVSTAVLAGLQCFVCSVEFVGVHVVCACARAQFHNSCGLACILVLCVKGEKKKRQSAILLYYRSLLGAKYGWGSPCFAWKSLGWTRVYVTKTMWKLWETSKIFSSSYWCPKYCPHCAKATAKYY